MQKRRIVRIICWILAALFLISAASLLLAPLSYFRSHMTGNIHGRLNRSLEGTVQLIKLLFMDFAPAVSTGIPDLHP